MLFNIGPIPDSPTFQPDIDGWTKAKEPKAWVVRWLLATPVSILLGIGALLIVVIFSQVSIERFSLIVLVAIYFGTLIVHESIHALLHPDGALTDKTIIGFWPSHLIFYAHYDDPRPRENFLLGSIAPFIVLTIIPLMILSFSDLDAWELAAVAILNAIFSCIDVISFVTILIAIPKKSFVRNKGWYTYWRMPHAT